MKIIDLLNKIANGEEAPEKIKWEDTIYAYSDYDKDYLEFPFSEEEYQGLFCMKDSILTQYLNDEVEILEEEKKIPEKLPLEGGKISDNEFLAKYITHNRNTINGIIDYLNYLKSKGEDKDE